MRPLQYRDVTKEQLVNRIDDLATIIEGKDEQIKALVTALKAYMEWEPATTLRADYRTIMYRAAEAAIKEAIIYDEGPSETRESTGAWGYGGPGL